jgi:hypothetical protein
MAHWPRRTATLLAAVLVAAALGISPAEAGGPTSVLLSAPDVPKVVAAGYNDKAYDELQRLVTVAGKTELPNDGDHDSGHFIRATWLIHDMAVWRLDVIYPDAPDGPWIATTVDRDGSGRMPSDPVWHRPANGAGLLKLLGSMGLVGDKFSPYSAGGPTTLPQASGETPEPVLAAETPTTTLKADQKALSGWRWTIPGFLLGALITYLAVRLVPRRRPWELIDDEDPEPTT